MSKNILVLKRIDFWVQIILVPLWLFSLTAQSIGLSFYFLKFSDYWTIPFFYFWVGVIQFFSFGTNTLILIINKNSLTLGRKIYSWFLLLIFILGLFYKIQEISILLGLFLLFCSPFLAIFYLWITWTELQILEKVNLEN